VTYQGTHGQAWSRVGCGADDGLPVATSQRWSAAFAQPDRIEVRALGEGVRTSSWVRWSRSRSRSGNRSTIPDSWMETISGLDQWLWCAGLCVHDGGEAVLIDTAYNAPAMIESCPRTVWRLMGICLTHGHASHANGLPDSEVSRGAGCISERRMSISSVGGPPMHS